MESLRILVVDDQNSVRKYIASILSGFTPHIDEAVNGRDALQLINNGEHSYNLVVTDYDMPELNGWDLCRHLKKHEKTAAIPIVMVSTFDTPGAVEKGFESGAAAFVPKKDASTKLRNKVAELLSCSCVLQGKHILVVEKSVLIGNVIENHLAGEGVTVLVAENGGAALDFLRNHPVDLVLTDVDMAGVNGNTLFEALKRNPAFAGIPVIISGSSEDAENLRAGIRQGAAGYILKPFNPQDLVIQIEKILSDQFQFLLKDRERLHAERDMLLSSIMSLANALEARDRYTRGHSEAVTRIMEGMAQIVDVTPQELESIRMGSLLHDIGKIGISDTILQKNGRLTEAEFACIKQHPRLGAEILRSITLPGHIIPIVLYHHERFDGKGYPEGLGGTNIPFWARIAAVADAFDAMISDRPYRKGMEFGKAVAIIQEVRGTQLCPECVDIFLEWYEKNKGWCRPERMIPSPERSTAVYFG